MAANDPRPDPLVLPADELAAVRHLAAAARAADAAYRLAAARVVLYEFLHQYGRSDLPAFKVALDLASSLRKIIDGLGDEEAARPGPSELWQQAGGDGNRYRELLRQHGHLLSPGDEGYEEGRAGLPCGWPGRSDDKEGPKS